LTDGSATFNRELSRLQAAFAYLTDFNRATEWQLGLLESSGSPEGHITVGTTIREVRSMPGREDEFLGVVTGYDADQPTYTGRTTTGPFPARTGPPRAWV